MYASYTTALFVCYLCSSNSNFTCVFYQHKMSQSSCYHCILMFVSAGILLFVNNDSISVFTNFSQFIFHTGLHAHLFLTCRVFLTLHTIIEFAPTCASFLKPLSCKVFTERKGWWENTICLLHKNTKVLFEKRSSTKLSQRNNNRLYDCKTALLNA